MKKYKLVSLGTSILASSVDSLPPNICLNNGLFVFEDEARTFTCNQVESDERERIKFCQRQDVRDNCPLSCGICCEDSPLFSFKTKHGHEKGCEWIGEQAVRSFLYCGKNDENGKSISDSCPKACSSCKTYVTDNIPEYILDMTLAPTIQTTSPPTPSPAPTVSTCSDDKDFRYHNRLSCSRIKKNELRRQRLCGNNVQVRRHCPISCGLCCSDDETFTFLTSNSREVKSCSFLEESEFNRLRYCDRFKNGIMVKNICHKSCHNCMTRVSDKDIIIDKTNGNAASLSASQIYMPLFLGLSISFIAIGIILGMYSLYASKREMRQIKIKELNDTGDLSSTLSSADASFVAPNITNLGNQITSQTDVHKCTNFPCANCAKGQNILFIKAPKTIVERHSDGNIEFVKACDSFVCEEVTTEDILQDRLSLSLSNDSSQSNKSVNERRNLRDPNSILLSERDFIE